MLKVSDNEGRSELPAALPSNRTSVMSQYTESKPIHSQRSYSSQGKDHEWMKMNYNYGQNVNFYTVIKCLFVFDLLTHYCYPILFGVLDN